MILKDEICEIESSNIKLVKAVKESLPTQSEINELTEMFKILGDPTRLKIMLAVKEKELCVCDIAEIAEVTISAVSHQLRLLRTMNMVMSRKEGKMVYYSLDDKHVENLVKEALIHINEK